MLDPLSLARVEAAGGGLGRFARASNAQWDATLDNHRWLLGRALKLQPPLPEPCPARAAPPSAAAGASQDAAMPRSGRSENGERARSKARALKLRSWASGSTLGRCGHVLFVGGNVDQRHTFAEEPIDDATAASRLDHSFEQSDACREALLKNTRAMEAACPKGAGRERLKLFFSKQSPAAHGRLPAPSRCATARRCTAFRSPSSPPAKAAARRCASVGP